MLKKQKLTSIITLLLFIFSFSSESFARETFNKPNLLANTPIRLTLLQDLRSGLNGEGNGINLSVARDVMDSEGNILIKAGAQAFGSVLISRSRGAFSRKGAIKYTLRSVIAVDNQEILLKGTEQRNGGGNSTLTILGFICFMWPLAFCKGSNAAIPNGTIIEGFIAESKRIKVN